MRCAAWTRRWTRHNRKTRILACFRPIRAAKRGCPHSRRVLEGNRTTLGRYRLDWALFPLLELGHIVASVALTDISTALSPGLRRGFFYIDSVSAKVKCFSFIQDWVEKKVRRHMGRAQNRKGFMPLIEEWLAASPHLSAVDILVRLEKQVSDRFGKGQLRTVQRLVKRWRGKAAHQLINSAELMLRIEPPDVPALAMPGSEPTQLSQRKAGMAAGA
jgi:hypothetical protein